MYVHAEDIPTNIMEKTASNFRTNTYPVAQGV